MNLKSDNKSPYKKRRGEAGESAVKTEIGEKRLQVQEGQGLLVATRNQGFQKEPPLPASRVWTSVLQNDERRLLQS